MERTAVTTGMSSTRRPPGTRPRRWARRVPRALVLGALGVLVLLGGAARPVEGSAGVARAPVQEEPQEDSTLTWSVRPAPTASEPERSNFSYDADPGATVRDSIRVRNYGAEPLPLAIYASDAMTTSSGALDLLPAGEQPTDVGAWTVLDAANIEVPPLGFVDVPFTMVVPVDAESGDHTGGIVTSYRAPGTDDEGEPVVLDRRLGSRMYVRVGGELRPQLEVSDLMVTWSGTPNPLGTGTLHVGYTVTNTGNVRLGADQVVVVGGRFGLPGREVTLEPMGELLPSSSLDFSVDVPDVWPTFRTTTRVELDLVPTREGDEFDADTPRAAASVGTWTVPWPQLVVLLVLVGIPLRVRWTRRRRRRREAVVVQQAVQTTVIVQEAVQAALAAHGAGSGDGPGPGGDEDPSPTNGAVPPDGPPPSPSGNGDASGTAETTKVHDKLS